MHLFDLGENMAGAAQGFAGPRQAQPARLALEQGRLQFGFQLAQTVAGRGGSQVGASGATGQVVFLGNGNEGVAGRSGRSA